MLVQSVTESVNEDVVSEPTALAFPEIVPVEDEIESPPGSEPDATA